MDTIHAAGMDETYGTYVDDACFDIHDYDNDDDDTEHDTDDDIGDDTAGDITDATDDDTDDGGRGNRRPLPGGAVHFPPVMIDYVETLILELVLSRNKLWQLQIQHK